MMTEHKLKCWPEYFEAILCGDKNFEIRRDDRGFQKGDVLVLQKWSPKKGYLCHIEPNKITELKLRITWILTGGQLGLEPGYVAMALEPL